MTTASLQKPIIGLTGCIGSGKSTVASIFKKLGAAIIDADLLARKVVEPNSPGLLAVIQHFGKELLLLNGELDRKKLASIIFNSNVARKELEQIIHPLIRQEFSKKLEELKSEDKAQPIVAVIPLLFESNNSYPELDKVVVVSANVENCTKRIMQRDNCTLEFALKKLASQMPIEEKEKCADYVIFNNSNLIELESEAKNIWQKLT